MPKRKYYRKIYPRKALFPKEKIRYFFLFLKLVVFLFLAFFIFTASLFIYYAKGFPRPEIFTERQLAQSTKIYDRTGQVLLYEIYGEEKRTVVPLSAVPQDLKNAVIATEDANFYHHFGVDPKGIIRAILSDLKIGKAVYGGSTIPQQLIRSTFLSSEKTAERKTREIVLALELDRRYSKDQILEWYLNQVPFGRNAYGVEAASQVYFKKSVSEISLAEAATLTALVKSPSYYSLKENDQELMARKDYVLNRMENMGYISKDAAESTKKEEVKIADVSQPIKAPHFVMYVKDYLESKYGEEFLKERGLKVFTSLDWNYNKRQKKQSKQVQKIMKNTGLLIVLWLHWIPKPEKSWLWSARKIILGNPIQKAVRREKTASSSPTPTLLSWVVSPVLLLNPLFMPPPLKRATMITTSL
jgi:penicillin-binding protein 1A